MIKKVTNILLPSFVGGGICMVLRKPFFPETTITTTHYISKGMIQRNLARDYENHMAPFEGAELESARLINLLDGQDFSTDTESSTWYLL